MSIDTARLNYLIPQHKLRYHMIHDIVSYHTTISRRITQHDMTWHNMVWHLNKKQYAYNSHLNNEAASKSSRKSFWKIFDGKVFHAIVSVTAVKIQWSSPLGVFLSEWSPGIFSLKSTDISPIEWGFYIAFCIIFIEWVSYQVLSWIRYIMHN